MNISRNVFLAALVAFNVSAFASEGEKAPENAGQNTELVKEATTGSTIVEYAKWIVCLPVTLPMGALDNIAHYSGIEKGTKWLGSASQNEKNEDLEKGTITQFFADHQVAFQRAFAAAGTAGVIALGYKLWKEFVAEGNNSDEYADEINVFDEDFDAENN